MSRDLLIAPRWKDRLGHTCDKEMYYAPGPLCRKRVVRSWPLLGNFGQLRLEMAPRIRPELPVRWHLYFGETAIPVTREQAVDLLCEAGLLKMVSEAEFNEEVCDADQQHQD